MREPKSPRPRRYSDGLTDACNDRAQRFDLARLDTAVREAAGGGAEAVKRGVLGALEQFLGGACPHDDVSLLVLARMP